MTAEVLFVSPERQIAYAIDEDESLCARVKRICDKYIQDRQKSPSPGGHSYAAVGGELGGDLLNCRVSQRLSSSSVVSHDFGRRPFECADFGVGASITSPLQTSAEAAIIFGTSSVPGRGPG